jgi:hypothetical protein
VATMPPVLLFETAALMAKITTKNTAKASSGLSSKGFLDNSALAPVGWPRARNIAPQAAKPLAAARSARPATPRTDAATMANACHTQHRYGRCRGGRTGESPRTVSARRHARESDCHCSGGDERSRKTADKHAARGTVEADSDVAKEGDRCCQNCEEPNLLRVETIPWINDS